MRQREALRSLNEVKSVKKYDKKLRIENERKVTQELEINQDPFK